MKQNIFKIALFAALILSISTVTTSAYEIESTSKISTEKTFEKMGYQTLTTVIHQFESKHKVKVSLPKKMPFAVTHKFGRIDTIDGKLELYYFNDRTKEMAKIFVELGDSHINLHRTDKMLTLKNKNKLLYRHIPVSNMTWIQLPLDGLTYHIVISNRERKHPVTEQDILDTVNSLE